MPALNTFESMIEQLPQPLAAAYKRFETEQAEKVTRLNVCLGTLLRLVAALLVPDYLRGDPDLEVEKRWKELQKPSNGHWLCLLKHVVRTLSNRTAPRPFAPEALAWAQRSWPELDRLVYLRNDAHHRDLGNSETWLTEALASLQNVVADASWLRSYRPLQVLRSDLQRDGRTRGDLRYITGTALSTPVPFCWSPALLSDAIYLLAPDASGVLEISPFVQVHPDPDSGYPHVFLWDRLEGSGIHLADGLHKRERSAGTWAEGQNFVTMLASRPLASASVSFHAPDHTLRYCDQQPRFERGPELGSGGMARVFEAYDHQLQRRVALKVLEPAVAADARLSARFVREARLMTGIRHPHVMPAFDLLTVEDGRPALLMPLAAESLAARIRRGALDERATTALGKKLLSALAHLHERGIVHRDVKPANVLFDHENEPLLADFGIARWEEDGTLATTHAANPGTLAYMSPEQRTGRTIDGRTDVYSLAVTLHEVHTGELPLRPGDRVAGQLGEWLRQAGALEVARRPSAAEALRLLETGPAAPFVKAPGAIIKTATRFRVDEDIARALETGGGPLVITILGGTGQRVHPSGTYVIPREAALRFIESKRGQPNWKVHQNWHSVSVPVPLRAFFRPD